MIIEHITSIERALKIVETGRFECYSKDPMHSDACLNCLNGNFVNNYAAEGITLKFEWSGELRLSQSKRPLTSDVLYDE